MAITAAQLDVVVKADTRAAERDLKRMDQTVEQTGKSMSTMGKLATAAAVGGVGALALGLGGAVKTAADFQQSLANVRAATGSTEEQMKAMRTEALKIGVDTSKSASEAVEAMGELAKAGMDVGTIVGGAARSVVQLAEATGISVPEAATLASDALNVFKNDGLNAADVANILAKNANASSIDVSDLGQSLRQAGTGAAAAGMTLSETAAALGIMGNQGLKASDAGTSLKTMLAALTPNSDKAAAAMQALGINAFNADGSFKSMREIIANLSAAFGPLTEEQRAMNTELIFGADGSRALNALLKEGVTGWDAYGAAVAGADSVEEQSRKRRESLLAQLDAFKGTLETIAISIGTVFLPPLSAAIGAVSDFVTALSGVPIEGEANRWQTLALRVREVAGTVAELAGAAWGAIGPVAAAAGQAIISGLQTAVAWITDTALPAIRSLGGDAWANISTAAGEVKTWFDQNWPSIRETIATAFEDAQPRAESVLAALRAASQGVAQEIQNDWPPVQAAIARAFEEATPAAIRALNQLGEEGRRWADFFSTEWPNLIEAGITFAMRAFAPLTATIGVLVLVSRQGAQDIGDALGTVIGGAITTVGNLLSGLSQIALGIFQVITGALSDLRVAWDGVVNIAQGFVRILGEIPGPIGYVASGLQTAATMANALAAGISQTISAANGALGPLQALADKARDVGNIIRNLPLMPGSPTELEQGIAQTAIAVGQMTGELRGAQMALEPLNRELRDNRIILASIPKEEEELRKAHEAHIQTLQQRINLQRDYVAALKEQIGALKEAQDAATGFGQAIQLREGGGAGALKIADALVDAIVQNTAESGAKLEGAITAMINDAVKVLGPSARVLGEEIMAATAAALADPSNPDLINGVMALVNNLNAQVQAQQERIKAAGTLSGQTFGLALTAALSDQGMVDMAGAAGRAIFDALDAAATEGGAKNIQKLAELTGKMQTELLRLPEFIRGQLGTDLITALEGLANAPDDAGLREKLTTTLSEINQALSLIPKDFAKLAPEMQAVVMRLLDAVKSGAIPLKNAVDQWGEIARLIPKNFADLAGPVRAAIMAIVEAFQAGALSAEQAAERIGAAVTAAAESAKAAREAALAELAEIRRNMFPDEQPGAGAAAAAGGGGGGGGGFGQTRESAQQGTWVQPVMAGGAGLTPWAVPPALVGVAGSRMGEGGFTGAIMAVAERQAETNDLLERLIELISRSGGKVTREELETVIADAWTGSARRGAFRGFIGP